jgi:hypothetical protein
LGLHVRKRGLHRPERGPQPGGERRSHHVVGLLLQRDERRVALRVVDKDVKASVGVDGLIDHALHLVASADVDVDEPGGNTEVLADLRCRPLAVVGAHVGDHHPSPLSRVPAGDTPSNAHASAGHDRHAPRESISHSSPSVAPRTKT